MAAIAKSLDTATGGMSSVSSSKLGGDVNGAGFAFGDLMSDLDAVHRSSLHNSNSRFRKELDGLGAVVRQGIEDSRVQYVPGQSVIAAIHESTRAQVAALQMETTLNMTQAATNGIKKSLTDILNQK